jgi:hypothetical protein
LCAEKGFLRLHTCQVIVVKISFIRLSKGCVALEGQVVFFSFIRWKLFINKFAVISDFWYNVEIFTNNIQGMFIGAEGHIIKINR